MYPTCHIYYKQAGKIFFEQMNQGKNLKNDFSLDPVFNPECDAYLANIADITRKNQKKISVNTWFDLQKMQSVELVEMVDDLKPILQTDYNIKTLYQIAFTRAVAIAKDNKNDVQGYDHELEGFFDNFNQNKNGDKQARMTALIKNAQRSAFLHLRYEQTDFEKSFPYITPLDRKEYNRLRVI